MSARPPDPALAGDGWRALWLERLETATPFAENWLSHQHRDGYWRSGSPCDDYSTIDCPVYVVGGWADPYRQAVLDLLEQLTGPRKGLIGPWAHRYPEEGTPGPAIDFRGECVRWWDQWLKGVNTGVLADPDLRAWMPEGVSSHSGHGSLPGRWVGEEHWPSPGGEAREYFLGAGKLAVQREPRRGLAFRGSERAGFAAGTWCPWGREELPGDQSHEDELSLCFTSDPLEERIEILGAPAATLELSADRPLALVAVRLCDVSPSGPSTLVARGLLNLCHRGGSDEPRPLDPGRRYTIRVPLDAAAYAFRPGHRLRLAISPTYWPWAWPSPEPVTLTVHAGGPSRLELPTRAPSELDGRVGFPGPPLTDGCYGESETTATFDPATGVSMMVVERDRGRRRAREDGLEVGGMQRDVFSIVEGDPLSGVVECEREMELSRGAWSARVETQSRMTADAGEFCLVNRLEAFENGERIFARERSFRVPRDLV